MVVRHSVNRINILLGPVNSYCKGPVKHTQGL
jgi:hypothetical protein